MTDDDAHARTMSRATQMRELGALELRSERDGGTHVVELSGELDIAAADGVQGELERVEATDAESIVLDLSGLSFIDSTGVRLVLTACRRQADADGRLSLRRGPETVQRVFRISGVEERLPFVD